MHLVNPFLLNEDSPVPATAIAEYAQNLCEDYARRLGVQAPRIFVTDAAPDTVRYGRFPCQSPSSRLAHLTQAGDISLTSVALSDPLLRFVLGHCLAHLIVVFEWECDLIALDLTGITQAPFAELATRIIALTLPWRAIAFQFASGQRAVAIGDALASRVWEDPLD